MRKLSAPAVDPETVKDKVGYDPWYPPQYSGPCRDRAWKALGDAAGLTQFGVNLVSLPPGTWSSQRHWHMNEDEFVFVLEGEVVLVTDAGEQLLSAGMAAGFPAGHRDGHHLVNRSGRVARVLEVGTRAETDEGEYSDIDMKFQIRDGTFRASRKDGTPF